MFKKKQNPLADPPGWHPDFREPSRLPDLRVVRTGTFAAILSVASVCGALLYVGQQEFFIYSNGHLLRGKQADLEEDKKALAKRVELSKQFEGLAARVSEVAGFGGREPLGSEVILALSKARPDYVRFETVNVNRKRAVIRVVARSGNLESLLLVPGRLAAHMRADPEIAALFSTIDPPTFDTPKERDLIFDLVLHRKAAP
jgi:hypothetical protein